MSKYTDYGQMPLEAADRTARTSTGWIGRRIARPEITTLVGIRQAFPIRIHPGKKHLSWDRQAIKGPTYLVTDRGHTDGGRRR